MTESASSQSLADRALQRLRKLSAGNGLEPAAISVLETQEQVFSLDGRMEISPLFEAVSASYPGGARGKDRKTVASLPDLQAAVAKHKEEFKSNFDWVEQTLHELSSHEGQGWGLENAKVTLSKKSVIYSATENCPSCIGRQTLTCTQCNGQGTVICTQCQGEGRELCYYCGGRGEDPQQPGQKCHTCEGTRYAPCRFCKTHKYLPCPTCDGRRGTPCPACQASGKMTQEVAVTCGAETHFSFVATGLPSGLRRGLDRIGIANLYKGHADIAATKPKDDEDPPKEGAPIPVLLYKAMLPYAELRMGFGGKKAVVSVVGKRCAINGVPSFLDESLKPWSSKLHQAALGHGPIEAAMEARALNDILSLTLTGKGRIEEVRKLYPFGMSSQAMTSYLSDTRLALNKTTLKTRTLIAVLCGLLSALFFYGFFDMGTEARLSAGLRPFLDLLINLIAATIALTASWTVLNFSTRFVLKKRFPQLRLGLQQKIGKTGYSMLAGIFVVFIIFALSAPIKPSWLYLLKH